MRLLAHNILMCKMKGCDITHFPLKIVPEKVFPAISFFLIFLRSFQDRTTTERLRP